MLSTQYTVRRTLCLPVLEPGQTRFLVGPREAGKSALVRHNLPQMRALDLVDPATFFHLSREPERLGQDGEGHDLVIIEEVQKLPEVLPVVRRLAEARGTRFILTASSIRRLKRDDFDLFGGAQAVHRLHPLTSRELGDRFDLERALSRGTLPAIYFSDTPEADLGAYAGTYLQREICAEGAARSISGFSRFLGVAAHCSGRYTNFSEVASEANVPRTTVYEYCELLADTLTIRELPAWTGSKIRKALVSGKSYFFDVGVMGAFRGHVNRPGDPGFWDVLETYVMHELNAWSDYVSGAPLACWRCASGFEVDFIIDGRVAVDVQAKTSIAPRDLRGLRALGEEGLMQRLVCVSLEPDRRRVDGIELMPLTDFLHALWNGGFDQ